MTVNADARIIAQFSTEEALLLNKSAITMRFNAVKGSLETYKTKLEGW
jgi:hypothetical protein